MKNYVYWSLGFAILVICVMLFLTYKVMKLPDEANQCMTNPMVYAQKLKQPCPDWQELQCRCESKQIDYLINKRFEVNLT